MHIDIHMNLRGDAQYIHVPNFKGNGVNAYTPERYCIGIIRHYNPQSRLAFDRDLYHECFTSPRDCSKLVTGKGNLSYLLIICLACEIRHVL